MKNFFKTNAGTSLLMAFFCTVILLLITLYHNGGNLHSESTSFFVRYLDGRALVNQIFDPVSNDWECYQARELSYLFDAMDARFTAFLIKNRIIWFHSFCSLLLCGIMVFIQQYWTRKLFPSIPGIVVSFISLFFVLSGPVSGLDYFRCAKYLAALGLWGAFFSGYGAFRSGKTPAKVCFCLSLLLMALSDRQGFYFTAVISGTAAAVMFFLSLKNGSLPALRMRFVTLSAFAVTCFGIINNLYLTPAVIRAVNGYEADFSYQRELAVESGHLLQGFYFLFGNMGSWLNHFTGTCSMAAVTGVLLAAGIAVELLRQYREKQRRALYLALIWGCFIIAMFICSVIMVARLDLIMESEFFYGVYTITFMVIVLALLTLTAAGAGEKFCRLLLIILCVSVSLRLGGALSSDKFIPESAFENGIKLRQHTLNKALLDPGFDESKHLLPYRMRYFLEFCREQGLIKTQREKR